MDNTSPLLSWVWASIAIYAVVANTGWLAVWLTGPHGTLVRWLTSLPGQLLIWAAKLLWLVLPGYIALIQGRLSPRQLGLSQFALNWELGRGLLFATTALVVFVAAGITYRRSHSAIRPYLSFSHGLALTVMLVMLAGALQWQWAFYRSVLIDLLAARGVATPVYAGTWLTVVVIAAQGALNLWLWRDLRTPGRAESRVLRAALLGVSSVLYLLSRNFWLAWLLHALVTAILEPRTAANKKGSRQLNVTGSLSAQDQ
ncbi:MAG: hypothetical protein WAZ19_11655 [Anaerolineae bacterium]